MSFFVLVYIFLCEGKMKCSYFQNVVSIFFACLFVYLSVCLSVCLNNADHVQEAPHRKPQQRVVSGVCEGSVPQGSAPQPNTSL